MPPVIGRQPGGGRRGRPAVAAQRSPTAKIVTQSFFVDAIPPVVSITIGPSTTRISRVSGKDLVTFSFSVDQDYQAFQVRVVPSSSSPHTAGTLIESGSGGNLGQNVDIEVTDDELVNADPGEGTKVIKVFAQNSSGGWSE